MHLAEYPTAATTVVVVTADPEQQRRVARALEARGHRVLGFTSAAAAIAEIAPPKHTVLLVDHELADMSGAQLIDQLRGRGVKLPTIVTVPMHAIRTAVQAIRVGATDVLEAPFDDGVLAQSVRLALAAADRPETLDCGG